MQVAEATQQGTVEQLNRTSFKALELKLQRCDSNELFGRAINPFKGDHQVHLLVAGNSETVAKKMEEVGKVVKHMDDAKYFDRVGEGSEAGRDRTSARLGGSEGAEKATIEQFMEVLKQDGA